MTGYIKKIEWHSSIWIRTIFTGKYSIIELLSESRKGTSMSPQMNMDHSVKLLIVCETF